jgi:hypothetical protein
MRSLPILALFLVACTTESAPDAPPSATLDPDADPQLSNQLESVDATWTNESIPEQAGTFHIVFAFVPNNESGGPIDAVVGLSKGAAASFTDLGPIVRFSPAGTLDVRNGSAYAADQVFAYSVGQTYQIRLDIDMTRHRYTVRAQEDGGPTTTVASDYAFRSEQSGMARLDNVARIVDSEAGSLQQVAYEVTPSL